MARQKKLDEIVKNHLGWFLVIYTATLLSATGVIFRVFDWTIITSGRKGVLERAESQPAPLPSTSSAQPALVKRLEGLPPKSRALLMLVTGEDSKEAWSEDNAARGARDAAGPLRDHAYARELTSEELRLIGTGSHQTVSYGIQLTPAGIEIHDQMVSILSELLGSAEAAAWIKERRHEPIR